jgi:hypothetical protein
LFRFWSYRRFVFAGILVEEPVKQPAASS